MTLRHLGETLPFLVRRVDQAPARPGQKAMSFRDVFCGNSSITAGGTLSNPALLSSSWKWASTISRSRWTGRP